MDFSRRKYSAEHIGGVCCAVLHVPVQIFPMATESLALLSLCDNGRETCQSYERELKKDAHCGICTIRGLRVIRIYSFLLPKTQVSPGMGHSAWTFGQDNLEKKI